VDTVARVRPAAPFMRETEVASNPETLVAGSKLASEVRGRQSVVLCQCRTAPNWRPERSWGRQAAILRRFSSEDGCRDVGLRIPVYRSSLPLIWAVRTLSKSWPPNRDRIRRFLHMVIDELVHGRLHMRGRHPRAFAPMGRIVCQGSDVAVDISLKLLEFPVELIDSGGAFVRLPRFRGDGTE
jgi:hypothetical protein